MILIVIFILSTTEKPEPKLYIRIDNLKLKSKNESKQTIMCKFLYLLVTKMGHRFGSNLYHVLILNYMPPAVSIVLDYYYNNKSQIPTITDNNIYFLVQTFKKGLGYIQQNYLKYAENPYLDNSIGDKIEVPFDSKVYKKGYNLLHFNEDTNEYYLFNQNTRPHYKNLTSQQLLLVLDFFYNNIDSFIDELFMENKLILKIDEHFCSSAEIKMLVFHTFVDLVKNISHILGSSEGNSEHKKNYHQNYAKKKQQLFIDGDDLCIESLNHIKLLYFNFNYSFDQVLVDVILSRALHYAYYKNFHMSKITPLNMPLQMCFIKDILQEPKKTLKQVNDNNYHQQPMVCPEILVKIEIYNTMNIKLGELICEESLYDHFYSYFFIDNDQKSSLIPLKKFMVYLKFVKKYKNVKLIKTKHVSFILDIVQNINLILMNINYKNKQQLRLDIFNKLIDTMFLYSL